MDFSKILTKVPAFRQPVAFPPASAEDPPFLVQVHGGKWARQTEKPASFLVSVSHYLATYFQLTCPPQLRWCPACDEFHSPKTICLSQSLLSDESHLVMLVELLDGSLTFSWCNMEHFKVLQLCDFFRFKQSYVLPMLKASLRDKYALFYEEFSFLPFIFRLCMCNFDALATFSSDYLAFYNPLLYMSSDLLFRTKNFNLLLHTLKFRQGFYDGQDPNFTYRYSVTEIGFR